MCTHEHTHTRPFAHRFAPSRDNISISISKRIKLSILSIHLSIYPVRACTEEPTAAAMRWKDRPMLGAQSTSRTCGGPNNSQLISRSRKDLSSLRSREDLFIRFWLRISNPIRPVHVPHLRGEESVCMCARACACVRACVRARVRVCVCARACVCMYAHECSM